MLEFSGEYRMPGSPVFTGGCRSGTRANGAFYKSDRLLSKYRTTGIRIDPIWTGEARTTA